MECGVEQSYRIEWRRGQQIIDSKTLADSTCHTEFAGSSDFGSDWIPLLAAWKENSIFVDFVLDGRGESSTPNECQRTQYHLDRTTKKLKEGATGNCL